ncbi:MAG: type II toxin-antitoxin system HicB family antitoxin [Rhodanobacter sp.]
MNNTMKIDGHMAVIQYDPEIDMLRGEFIGLNGGADFYAKDLDALRKEGETSLRVFLQTCKAHQIEPMKAFSGKFQTRIPPKIHAQAAEAAAARGVSLNNLVQEAIEHELNAGI